MNTAPSACQYCGAANWGSSWCGTCGAQLQPEPPPEWPAQAPAAPAAQGPLEILAAGLAAAAALLVLISTFLPWAPGNSYWEFKAAEDVVLVLLVLSILTCLALRLVLPGARVPRVAVAVLLPALAAVFVLDAFEIIAETIDLGADLEVGVVVGLMAGAGLGTALLLLLFADARALSVPTRGGGRDPLLTGGLVLVAAGAFLALVTNFLPIGNGVTVWEANTLADVLVTLVELPLPLVAVAALALPQVRALTLPATILGGFVAATVFFGAVNALADGAGGAWTFANLILCGPLVALGTCLVALRSYPSLGRRE